MEAAITPAEERYLEAIGRLGPDAGTVSGAALARALGLSAPTVHEMLQRLDAAGLAVRPTGQGWTLTERGRHRVATLVRRREIVERFLREVLAVPEAELSSELERMVPNVSPHLERRMHDAVATPA